jgi:hypothetical protein
MNVPPVAGSSLSQMFPRAEQIGSLFSQNTGSSSRENVNVGLTRYEAKASEAINLIQSGSHMLVQAHKDFITCGLSWGKNQLTLVVWILMADDLTWRITGLQVRNSHLCIVALSVTRQQTPQHMMLCLIFLVHRIEFFFL